ncbi:MAG: OmpH family outer membrane protein [Armatimonadota bacterium]
MKRVVLWAAAAVAVVFAASAPSAWAAAAEAPKFGVVDMEQLGRDYRQMQELNQQFQDFQAEQESRLKQSYDTRLLTEAEAQEYSDLTSTAAPTEANRNRLKELQGLSATREQRLQDLQTKQERTPEDEAEMKQWNDLYQQRMGELTTLRNQLEKSRQERFDELNKIITDSVNNAIREVAEAQKLPIVVRKEMVLYGGEDITSAVLLKLNGARPKP